MRVWGSVQHARGGFPRFRCNHGTSFRDGIFGVIRRAGDAAEPAIEDFESDYSEREANTIWQVIREFATNLAGVEDTCLVEHIKAHIAVYVSDGAASALKVGRLLKHMHLPALLMCLRDPAHAVRIACKDPLHAEDRFGRHWRDIFDSRHALVPDIQNSDAWRAKLEACQRQVLREGPQGGSLNLTKVLRHLSFAKQRFESFAEPARKLCLMLQAVAMLLASVAGDCRKDTATRARASELLEGMTPEAIVVAGLTADYSSECLDFIRRFDADYDPALVLRYKNDFIARMRTLFFEGWAVVKSDTPVIGVTAVEAAMEQVADCPVFYYGHKRHVLWSSGAASQVKESMHRLQEVVRAMPSVFNEIDSLFLFTPRSVFADYVMGSSQLPCQEAAGAALRGGMGGGAQGEVPRGRDVSVRRTRSSWKTEAITQCPGGFPRAAEAMIERLDAELDEHDLANSLEFFDVASWLTASDLRKRSLNDKLKGLARALRLRPYCLML
jgi:hypothetical protein